MNSKVDIKGDAGVAVGTNQGTIINNIYSTGTEKIDKANPEMRSAISELLGFCDPRGQRQSIQRINLELFKQTDFKSLTVVQVKTLNAIAREADKYAEDKIRAAQQTHTEKFSALDEVDFNKFFDETGIRASTPARAALRLLFKENVKPTDAKLVWNDTLLDYKDDNQFHLKTPKWHLYAGWSIFSAGLVCIALLMFIYFAVNAHYQAHGLQKVLFHLAMASYIVFAGWYFLWISLGFLRPYYTAIRIKTYVEKINEKLKSLRK